MFLIGIEAICRCTEVVYFATGDLEADGGIMITASHNPADYNGLKLVREQSKPISADTGLMDIRDIAEGDERSSSDSPGRRTQVDVSNRYVDRLLSFIDPDKLKPLKIVGNPGSGGAKLALDLLEPRLPFEFVKVHYEPDGTFPNGVPNPMLEENRGSTIDAIKESGMTGIHVSTRTCSAHMRGQVATTFQTRKISGWATRTSPG